MVRPRRRRSRKSAGTTRALAGEDILISQRYEERTTLGRRHDLYVHHHLGSMRWSALVRKKYAYGGKTARSYLARARSQHKLRVSADSHRVARGICKGLPHIEDSGCGLWLE